jgi:hypothetical protein
MKASVPGFREHMPHCCIQCGRHPIAGSTESSHSTRPPHSRTPVFQWGNTAARRPAADQADAKTQPPVFTHLSRTPGLATSSSAAVDPACNGGWNSCKHSPLTRLGNRAAPRRATQVCSRKPSPSHNELPKISVFSGTYARNLEIAVAYFDSRKASPSGKRVTRIDPLSSPRVPP